MSLARFDDGGPDLAIRHGPGHWPGLRSRYLMDDALFPVAAPSLRGVDGIADPADLLAFPLLSDLALQGWPDWFRAAGLHGQRLPDMHMFNDSTDVMRARSEEHTSELQSLMRISYAVFCLHKKKTYHN